MVCTGTTNLSPSTEASSPPPHSWASPISAWRRWPERSGAQAAVAERQTGMLHERQRLAAEIHDTLPQELASIVMLLEAAQACLASRPVPPTA